MNPFALPIEWSALATFLTGIAAVGAAIHVATRQNSLRRDEVRVALLGKRYEVLGRFRSLTGEWWADGRLAREKEKELLALVRDIELYFDDETHRAADEIFKNTVFQNMFAHHAEMYSSAGRAKERLEASDKEFAQINQIIERIPELERLLVSSTRVGHIFK